MHSTVCHSSIITVLLAGLFIACSMTVQFCMCNMMYVSGNRCYLLCSLCCLFFHKWKIFVMLTSKLSQMLFHCSSKKIFYLVAFVEQGICLVMFVIFVQFLRSIYVPAG